MISIFGAGTKLTADMITLLNEMDGFKPDESVTVIAACNHPENFDKSLLRSGRFDKVIEIALPDPAQREVMLKRFNDKIPFAPELSLTKIAALTYNFTPADLKQLINYAHLFAKKENARNLTERHFLQAIIKVLQARYRTDKDLAVRLKVVSALLNMKKDEKKGFARLVGAVPSEIIELVNQIKNDSLYKAFKLDLPKGILLYRSSRNR